MATINQTQAAALMGVSARRLRQIEQEAGDVPKGPTGYDCKEFGHWLKSRILSELSFGDDGEVYDYKIEKARLTKLQADHEDLKVQEKTKELIAGDIVSDALSTVCSNIKTKMLSLPTKLAHKVTGIDDVTEIQALLEAQMREALQEIYTDGIQSLISDGDSQRRESDFAAAEADG